MPTSAPVIWSIDLRVASARRQPLLAHDALDVLDHHDGVVDQQADGEHHAEHGQHVDGEAERREHAERAEQHHRHRDGRDQRGAEVLQEQVHHQEHQHDRLEQRLDHLLDRHAHERRGVERETAFEARREEGASSSSAARPRRRSSSALAPVASDTAMPGGRLAVVAADALVVSAPSSTRATSPGRSAEPSGLLRRRCRGTARASAGGPAR